MKTWIMRAAVAASMATLGLAAVGIAGAQDGGGAEADRLAGTGREQTAVEISQHAFPDGSLEVYIANRAVNPDALVGGALSKGPILLVPQCGTLPDVVRAEIERLAPFRVYALGGTAVVCDSMLQQAAAASPTPQDRAPQTITRSMDGSGATDAFELVGGSYKVTYDYQAACYYYPSLDRTDEFDVVGLPQEDEGPAAGEVFIHNVEPGTWAIDMSSTNSSGCPWTITLSNE